MPASSSPSSVSIHNPLVHDPLTTSGAAQYTGGKKLANQNSIHCKSLLKWNQTRVDPQQITHIQFSHESWLLSRESIITDTKYQSLKEQTTKTLVPTIITHTIHVPRLKVLLLAIMIPMAAAIEPGWDNVKKSKTAVEPTCYSWGPVFG